LFANTGFAGAVFHVFYDKAAPGSHSAALHGRGGPGCWTTNGRSADDGRYDLWVLGPNGFHRHFKGNVTTGAAA